MDIPFYKGLASLLAIVLFYVMTENFPWHRPGIEAVFWMLVLEASAVLGLLASDSPLQYLVTINKSPLGLGLIFGILVPMYSAFLVQSYINSKLTSFQEYRGGNEVLQRRLEMTHRQLSSARIQSDDNVVHQVRRSVRLRTDSSSFDPAVVDEKDIIARSKQVYVDRVLDRLVFSSQVRKLAAWVRGQIDESQESIKRVMEDATPEELNQIMETVNMSQLLRHGMNASQVNNLLSYIMSERSTELSTISRAAVLHGLMLTESLPFIPQEMRWATDLFMGAQGLELTLLKDMLDSTGDFNNLYKLIFSDIVDHKLQKKVLKYIRAEGANVREDNRGLAAIKLLSDVDDTLYCSGGSFPAGSDTRYPRHALYPGVLALYEELDRHARQVVLQEDKAHKSSVADEAGYVDYVKVSVLTPWQKGGKVYEMDMSTKESIAHLQSVVQAKFYVSPAQQELVLTASLNDTSHEDELENGEVSKESVFQWNDGNIVFVSARPHVWKDVAENGSYRRFRQLVREGRMHAVPTMLTGSLYTGSLAVWLRLFEHIRNFVMDSFDVAIAAIAAAWKDARERRFHKRKSGSRRRSSVLSASVPVGIIGDDIDEAAVLAEGSDVSSAERFFSFTNSSIRRVGNHNWEAVGRTKIERVEQFATLYPEYDLLFFGDNAQGDLLAAEVLSRSATVGPTLKACFIHRVQSNDDPSLLSTVKRDERESFWAEHDIYFYDTYMGAALIAYNKGLISVRGLQRVGLAVHDDLLDFFIRFPHRDWKLVHSQVKRDIRAANKVLKNHPDGLQIPVPIFASTNLSL